MPAIAKSFTPKIQTSACPPQRGTCPRSNWRDILNAMRPGNWFEVPKHAYHRVRNAAATYTKGRYSLYQHPTKSGYHIYVRIK